MLADLAQPGKTAPRCGSCSTDIEYAAPDFRSGIFIFF